MAIVDRATTMAIVDRATTTDGDDNGVGAMDVSVKTERSGVFART
jgi:hypothetical protein